MPNPKLRLREQVGEVMRFKHYSGRTEESYWQWIGRYILFHAKRHPKEMGANEVRVFLSHLATTERVAGATQNQALNALVSVSGGVASGVGRNRRSGTRATSAQGASGVEQGGGAAGSGGGGARVSIGLPVVVWNWGAAVGVSAATGDGGFI